MRRRGGEWGESIPFPSRVGTLGSVMNSHSEVWGGAPAKNEFGAF